MKKRIWTDADKLWLDHYPLRTYRWIAERTGRSKSAVQEAMWRYRPELISSQYELVTKRMLADATNRFILANMGTLSWNQICAATGLDADKLRSRYRRMRARGICGRKRPVQVRQRNCYSPEQCEAIFTAPDLAALAKAWGRSLSGMRGCRLRMRRERGVGKSIVLWPQDKIDYLNANPDRLSYGQLAKKLGVTKGAVAGQINRQRKLNGQQWGHLLCTKPKTTEPQKRNVVPHAVLHDVSRSYRGYRSGSKTAERV